MSARSSPHTKIVLLSGGGSDFRFWPHLPRGSGVMEGGRCPADFVRLVRRPFARSQRDHGNEIETNPTAYRSLEGLAGEF